MGVYVTAVHPDGSWEDEYPRQSPEKEQAQESCSQTEIRVNQQQNQAARLKFSFHYALSVTLGKIMNPPGYQQHYLQSKVSFPGGLSSSASQYSESITLKEQRLQTEVSSSLLERKLCRNRLEPVPEAW